MKAAIITLALSENYGAVLQTYALAKVVEKFQVVPEVYDYNDQRRVIESLQGSSKIKHVIWERVKAILTFGIKKKKYLIFRRRYIPFTERHFCNNYDLKNDLEIYDVYIAGSDQIWNPDIFLYDTSYFLDFVPNGKKKISYASSFGKSTFNGKYREKCSELLNDFQYISVRENSGANIVNDLCKKEAEVVLDPTLLLDKQEWHNLGMRGKKRAQNFKGILCYVMPGDSRVTNVIENIAQQLHEKTGLPILRIGLKEYEMFKYGYKGVDIWAGPIDFISYFENAEYIITNSFHGTAFSVNFEKKFYVVINDDLDKENALHERILSFLERVQAKEAIISTNNPNLPEKWGVNLEEVSKALNKEREYSKEYLKKALDINKTVTIQENCFGCTACSAICPYNAIVMKENKEGFLYPEINSDKCVDCGLCKMVCPSEKKYIKKNEKGRAVAVQYKEKKIRENSTSGGAFVGFSNAILNQKGAIYGVVYTENFHVKHIRTTERMIRNQMCGSKYCQSDLNGIYNSVFKDLKNKIPVFFTGTSCQVDGLKRFLKQKHCDLSMLVTCDLVCHGVPSPLIWKEHIKYIEQVRKKKVQAYFNRSKIGGWHAHNECICYEDGQREWKTKLSQNFKDLFYGHYIIRESCQKCPYAGKPGVADITIGDFWGCEDIMPEIDDNLGTSIVIINSEKGEKLLEICNDQINFWDVPIELALKYNHNKPTQHNMQRKDFWIDYEKVGFEGVIKKYANDTRLGRIKYYSKKGLRSILVKFKILHV